MANIIKCNMCGKEFDFWDIKQEFNIEKVMSYGSGYDGCVLRLDLCCDCADKLIEQCAIPPIDDRR